MERNAKLKNFSRKLRKEMTKEEALLWYRFLRKCPVQFRRQYIIGPYIVDFYCHQAKLVIELDGSQHYEEENIAADAQRDTYLKEQGISVLRIPNNAVTENFPGVCEHISLLLGVDFPVSGENVREADKRGAPRQGKVARRKP